MSDLTRRTAAQLADDLAAGTTTSVEITRLAPRLPARKQKLILDMMRDMLGDDDAQN